jgi:hypothetical protein
VTDLMLQAGRAFDVGEDERPDTAKRRSHRLIVGRDRADPPNFSEVRSRSQTPACPA